MYSSWYFNSDILERNDQLNYSCGFSSFSFSYLGVILTVDLVRWSEIDCEYVLIFRWLRSNKLFWVIHNFELLFTQIVGFRHWERECGFLKVKVLIAQSCPTLCDPMDCSSPGSSVHGILQARILEWVAISFSRGTSGPKDQTWVSWITVRFFTIWATREAPGKWLRDRVWVLSDIIIIVILLDN